MRAIEGKVDRGNGVVRRKRPREEGRWRESRGRWIG